jgi:hypothetical protein
MLSAVHSPAQAGCRCRRYPSLLLADLLDERVPRRFRVRGVDPSPAASVLAFSHGRHSVLEPSSGCTPP